MSCDEVAVERKSAKVKYGWEARFPRFKAKGSKLRLRLNKRTSINSIPNNLKEKEMADFRKVLFAFAAVALLAGLTVPANAQLSTCIASPGVNTLIRAEGYNDLVGDILLSCTGGTPTATNTLVPQVDILITLN